MYFMHADVHGGCMVLDVLHLELQAVVTPLKWVLKPKSGASTRTGTAVCLVPSP